MKYLRFDDAIERRPGGLERARQIFQDVARLPLDLGAVVRKRRIDARLPRDADLEVAGELTSGKGEIACHDRLRVARQWPRAGRAYDTTR